MFVRFSPASKRVLRAAEQECRNRNHYYVGIEHVLLALLEERDSAVEAWFSERGVRPADLATDLRRQVGTGDDRLWDGILVTPRVRSVVRLAEGLAGESLVEPLQLLEAIRSEGRSAAAEVLAAAVRNAGMRSQVGS